MRFEEEFRMKYKEVKPGPYESPYKCMAADGGSVKRAQAMIEEAEKQQRDKEYLEKKVQQWIDEGQPTEYIIQKVKEMCK